MLDLPISGGYFYGLRITLNTWSYWADFVQSRSKRHTSASRFYTLSSGLWWAAIGISWRGCLRV